MGGDSQKLPTALILGDITAAAIKLERVSGTVLSRVLDDSQMARVAKKEHEF
jgi:hypothetical protein